MTTVQDRLSSSWVWTWALGVSRALGRRGGVGSGWGWPWWWGCLAQQGWHAHKVNNVVMFWQIGITCEGEHIALKSGSCIQGFGQQSTGEQLIQASVYFSIWDVRDHSLGIIPLLPASKLMDSHGYVE